MKPIILAVQMPAGLSGLVPRADAPATNVTAGTVNTLTPLPTAPPLTADEEVTTARRFRPSSHCWVR